ncbi:hypothetical protein D0T12_24655 [Actinomadura spongiicola]|uniref:Uncharacterized protein n=1 Tax=Actinomadura spongiicola TaxID=2303421 RepID=A0A372GB66_9ACTN|nr:hypothetical protein [Actinomadura spongiicola]RFS82648.1 hypothetical protein D0T12_24655 [Actinomadura spongiicola]
MENVSTNSSNNGRGVHRALSGAVGLLVSGALLGGAVDSVAASPVPSPGAQISTHAVAAASSTAKAKCPRWKVKGTKRVEVFEQPTKIKHIKPRKVWKRPGHVVKSPYCARWTYYNKREKRWYTAIAAPKAADNIGWIWSSKLRRVRAA